MGKKRVPMEVAERKLQEVGQKIAHQMPEGWGFCLVMFTYGGGPDARMTYLSSGERASTIKCLRELCDRMEKDPKGL